MEQLYLFSNHLTQLNDMFFKFDIVDSFEFEIEQVDSSERQKE